MLKGYRKAELGSSHTERNMSSDTNSTMGGTVESRCSEDPEEPVARARIE